MIIHFRLLLILIFKVSPCSVALEFGQGQVYLRNMPFYKKRNKCINGTTILFYFKSDITKMVEKYQQIKITPKSRTSERNVNSKTAASEVGLLGVLSTSCFSSFLFSSFCFSFLCLSFSFCALPSIPSRL